jgi:carboxylesterase
MPDLSLVNPHLVGDPFFWQAGPVGVFLSHGLTATPAEVRLLAQRLHAKGYTVAGPLLPGHGTHPGDLNRVTWQDWVASGEDYYRQLTACCHKVFLGGESMGGVLALYLASQHPEAAGVLAYAPAIKLNLSAFELRLLPILAKFVPYQRKSSIDACDNWQGYPVNPLKGALQLIRFESEVLKRLPQVKQPLLVIQGRLDTTVHPTVGQIILSRVSSPVKEHHWMENSTHVVCVDQELDEVARITLDFINKN